ncbi:hypothetical protein Aperf_G00000050624 [Anoplocephala perfoliata]
MLRLSKNYISSLFIRTKHHLSSRLSTSFVPVFDRKAKKLQRARASRREDPTLYDYLRNEAAFRLSDRVYDIVRVFDKAAELGCGRGHLIQYLTSDSIKFLYQCDSSPEVLKQIAPSPDVETQLLVVDEEFLPFADNSLNLVLSSLSLHWVNDLSSTFKQLRVALQLAETERLGGFYNHVNPFIESARFGELLKENGYSLISLDVDEIVIHYPSMFELMDDLRGMGESNAAINRPLRLNKNVLFAASSIYQERFGAAREGGKEGERCIPATFKLLFFIAWKPDPSQAKPLPRGSAEFSLKDLSRMDELSAKIEKKLKKQPE